MDWCDGYIAVDWGTTNRRGYRIAPGGGVESFEDDFGLMSVSPGEFPRAVAEIRERYGNLPMLLAGMVGSNRGWREASYVDCPAGAGELAAGILWIDEATGIVPGLCQRGDRGPDVMRGEEVQIVGARALGLIANDALACHPGTHSKWIVVKKGEINAFRTMMTGEMFGLLATQSILADLMTGKASPGEAFRAGVAEALAGEPLLSALFRVRARYLLDGGADDAVSRASGILIGSEIDAALRDFDGAHIALIGRPDLCALYADALSSAGRESVVIDGAKAFLGGIASLTRMLR